MTIQRVSGGARRNAARFNFRKFPRAPAPERPRVVRRYNPAAAYRYASAGTARCDESGRPAYDRRQLRPPTQAATAATKDLFRNSNDSARRASDCRRRLQLPPNLSTDDSSAHSFDRSQETLLTHDAFDR